jgi:hypothetical protein
MKWKCTSSTLLSVPVAAAAIGLGMNAIGQDRQGTSDLSLQPTHISPDHTAQAPTIDPEAMVIHDFGPGGPIMMFADEGGLIWDNGGPIGGLAMSNVHWPAQGLDRRLADDFQLSEESVVDAVRMGGLFLNGFPGTPPSTTTLRVTFYADVNGEPGGTVCPAQDISAGFTDSGEEFAGRVVWDILAKLNNPCALAGNTRYWVTIQPRNSDDAFFHIESFQPPAFGEEVHVDYPDLGAPAWTPGSTQFDDGLQRDMNFQLYGEGGEVTGACCLPKVDGEDADPICLDDQTAGECADLGGIFHSGQSCDNVQCPIQVECPDDDPCPGCMALGDINDDGTIDGLDLLALLGCWGPLQPGCECADINNDGTVDGLDLLALLGNWGPCPVASGGGGNVYQEDEPCGERLNDGCNLDEPAFGPKLTCGDTICGTAWTSTEFAEPPEGHLPGTCQGSCGGQSPDGCWCDDECFGFGDCCIDICDWCEPPDVPECVAGDVNVRDTDWYPINVADAKQRVTFEVHAEFPATASIIWVDEDCDMDSVISVASGSASAKVPFTLEACLQPGVEYKLVVVPTNFEGLPCDGEAQWGDAYTVTLSCEADACLDEKGACCFGDVCEFRDAVTCEIDGGVYLGDGTDCDGDPCVIPEGACCFNDGSCVVANQDECINDLQGAYRGNGTDCGDLVLIDIGCNGVEEEVSICRDCGDGGQVWCNLQDVCDEDLANDPFNGGCNFFDPEANEFDAAFEQLCCGDLVGGTIWSIAGQGRDLDWRVLTIKEDSAVTLEISHGFDDAGLDAVLLIAQAGCPASIVASGTVQDGGGLFTLLEAGTYYVIVTTQFVGDVPGATDLLCSDPGSGYQLQINCGELVTDLCENTCTAGFQPHPAYPQNTCSCNEDLCQLPPIGGTTAIDNPNFCCPNICDFCDGEGGVCDFEEVVCPDGALDENEPCGEDTNGGCNSTPNAFTAAQDGDVWCGTIWADGGSRDTDWYRLTVGSSGSVTVTITGEIPTVSFVVTSDNFDDDACPGIAVEEPIGWSNNGFSDTYTVTGLPVGADIVVFVSAGNEDGSGIFSDFPCSAGEDGEGFKYVLEISAP